MTDITQMPSEQLGSDGICSLCLKNAIEALFIRMIFDKMRPKSSFILLRTLIDENNDEHN